MNEKSLTASCLFWTNSTKFFISSRLGLKVAMFKSIFNLCNYIKKHETNTPEMGRTLQAMLPNSICGFRPDIEEYEQDCPSISACDNCPEITESK